MNTEIKLNTELNTDFAIKSYLKYVLLSFIEYVL